MKIMKLSHTPDVTRCPKCKIGYLEKGGGLYTPCYWCSHCNYEG